MVSSELLHDDRFLSILTPLGERVGNCKNVWLHGDRIRT